MCDLVFISYSLILIYISFSKLYNVVYKHMCLYFYCLCLSIFSLTWLHINQIIWIRNGHKWQDICFYLLSHMWNVPSACIIFFPQMNFPTPRVYVHTSICEFISCENLDYKHYYIRDGCFQMQRLISHIPHIISCGYTRCCVSHMLLNVKSYITSMIFRYVPHFKNSINNCVWRISIYACIFNL